MKIKMSLETEIINQLEPLPQDVYNYTNIEIDILKKTERALMIWYEGRERWIPLSVLRVDQLRKLWIANWFCEKERMFI